MDGMQISRGPTSLEIQLKVSKEEGATLRILT
jgi:hypothetical protein